MLGTVLVVKPANMICVFWFYNDYRRLLRLVRLYITCILFYFRYTGTKFHLKLQNIANI
jgi:hypothetical protein